MKLMSRELARRALMAGLGAAALPAEAGTAIRWLLKDIS